MILAGSMGCRTLHMHLEAHNTSSRCIILAVAGQRYPQFEGGRGGHGGLGGSLLCGPRALLMHTLSLCSPMYIDS